MAYKLLALLFGSMLVGMAAAILSAWVLVFT